MSKADLRVDWASAKAATYACENWHYSGSVPPPPHNICGVWESGVFVGVVIFSRGANNRMLSPFGLSAAQGCELSRVALRNHSSPVSRIIRMALKFLRRKSRSLRLVVSYADPSRNHHGGIYQAGGWIYTGSRPPSVEWVAPDGKQWHGRMVSKSGMKKVYGQMRKVWRQDQCRKITMIGKHRYLMPLDAEMREQIAVLSKPYPKRAGSTDSGTPVVQIGGGGATPTSALISEADHE